MIERIKNVNAVENEANKSSQWKVFHGIRSGLSQMAIMLQAPHLKNACVVFFIQFCILFGWVKASSCAAHMKAIFCNPKDFKLKIIFSSRLNTFRLWVVQLFAIIKEYEMEFTVEDSIDANLCSMIEYKVNKSMEYSSASSFNDDTENLNSTCEPVSYATNYSMHHIAQ